MRRFAFAALTATLVVASGTARGDPPNQLITQMALLRLVEHVEMFGNASFGPSTVHAQPEGRYWAVVGQVVSGALSDHMQHFVFVAAIRLICDDHADDRCWRLEKLALNNRIVYERKDQT